MYTMCIKCFLFLYTMCIKQIEQLSFLLLQCGKTDILLDADLGVNNLNLAKFITLSAYCDNYAGIYLLSLFISFHLLSFLSLK